MLVLFDQSYPGQHSWHSVSCFSLHLVFTPYPGPHLVQEVHDVPFQYWSADGQLVDVVANWKRKECEIGQSKIWFSLYGPIHLPRRPLKRKWMIFFVLSNMAYRYVGLIFAALSVLQKNRRPFFGGEERGLISRTVVIEPNRYVDFLQV